MKKLIVIVTACSLFLNLSLFCSSEEKPSAAPQKISQINVQKDDSYKVSIGDILNIQVYQEEDLSGDFEVKEDGTITYPLIGAVKVINLNKSDVENSITQLLEKDYLSNPYLHVSIKTYHQRNIMVLGCVQRPGSYSFPQDNTITLLQAISMAGGFSGYAAANGTKIVRTSSDGKKSTIDPRMNDIINGRRKDVDLVPNDLVFVPERLF